MQSMFLTLYLYQVVLKDEGYSTQHNRIALVTMSRWICNAGLAYSSRQAELYCGVNTLTLNISSI